MSRIGKKSIVLPDKVNFESGLEGQIKIQGPKGSLQWQLPAKITSRLEDKAIVVERSSEARNVKALHGLSRSLLANMVQGVSAGFIKAMEIQGVGFKAAVQGSHLNLSLGYSHPILFPIPEGIKVTVTENTKITVEGIDKQLVGQVAADIRAYHPPEPYKGKGIRYVGEQVLRKEGKTVQ